jgi:hypothetical protein
MMRLNNDFIVLIIALFFVIFLATMLGTKKEGLTSAAASSNAGGNGEAGLAAGYADEIKAKTVELQDTLLIAKYRKEYETTLINLDEYIGMLMVQQCLQLKLDGGKELLAGLDALNTLQSSKNNLNITMEHLDKQ